VAPAALAAAERAGRPPGVAAGCFQMYVPGGPRYRSIAWGASARVRLTGVVYGDQGLFLRREVFECVGGFPPLRLMEDVFISRALRRRGRGGVLPQRIYGSPRRWQRVGLGRPAPRDWVLAGRG